MTLFTFFYVNRRKYCFRENFRFPVFDRFTRFGMFWRRFESFWKMYVCLSTMILLKRKEIKTNNSKKESGEIPNCRTHVAMKVFLPLQRRRPSNTWQLTSEKRLSWVICRQELYFKDILNKYCVWIIFLENVSLFIGYS